MRSLESIKNWRSTQNSSIQASTSTVFLKDALCLSLNAYKRDLSSAIIPKVLSRP